MKACVLLASISTVLLTADLVPVLADDPQPAITWKMDYLEKTWGLKVKSAKVGADTSDRNFVLLLEFTKDLDDLKTLQAALGQLPGPGRKSEPPTLYFYFFDEDNVTLGKSSTMRAQGEVTGKKGDAIRVTVSSFPAALSMIKKIEARPGVSPPSTALPKPPPCP